MYGGDVSNYIDYDQEFAVAADCASFCANPNVISGCAGYVWVPDPTDGQGTCLFHQRALSDGASAVSYVGPSEGIELGIMANVTFVGGCRRTCTRMAEGVA